MRNMNKHQRNMMMAEIEKVYDELCEFLATFHPYIPY
jgi:hypothetical protein